MPISPPPPSLLPLVFWCPQHVFRKHPAGAHPWVVQGNHKGTILHDTRGRHRVDDTTLAQMWGADPNPEATGTAHRLIHQERPMQGRVGFGLQPTRVSLFQKHRASGRLAWGTDTTGWWGGRCAFWPLPLPGRGLPDTGACWKGAPAEHQDTPVLPIMMLGRDQNTAHGKVEDLIMLGEDLSLFASLQPGITLLPPCTAHWGG